jgi:SAM-dependent methyltransferase
MIDRSPIAVLPELATEPAATESYRRSHLGRGDEYDTSLASSPFDDYLSRAEELYLGRLLGTVLPARIGRYLDFACGTGRITRQLESRADESFGVDISPSMLRAARARCRFTEFVHADHTDFTCETHELSGFDVVTAFRFFGNAEPALRRDSLTAINRALRNGGYLILDNHRNPHALAQWAQRLTGGRSRLTLSYFELRRLLQQAGFRIRWQRPIGFWLYRTGLYQNLRTANPAAWPESGFAHPWFAPLAPDVIIAAQKIHDA